MAAVPAAAVVACSTKPAPPRVIRAHTVVHRDVMHADPQLKAEHYCSYCHGVNLAGGSGFEPSCYQCHGKNWLDTAFTDTPPFALHTILNGTGAQLYGHMPGQFSPAAACSACHGADLTGGSVNGTVTPGCDLCHEALWLTRTPPPGQQ